MAHQVATRIPIPSHSIPMKECLEPPDGGDAPGPVGPRGDRGCMRGSTALTVLEGLEPAHQAASPSQGIGPLNSLLAARSDSTITKMTKPHRIARAGPGSGETISMYNANPR